MYLSASSPEVLSLIVQALSFGDPRHYRAVLRRYDQVSEPGELRMVRFGLRCNVCCCFQVECGTCNLLRTVNCHGLSVAEAIVHNSGGGCSCIFDSLYVCACAINGTDCLIFVVSPALLFVRDSVGLDGVV